MRKCLFFLIFLFEIIFAIEVTAQTKQQFESLSKEVEMLKTSIDSLQRKVDIGKETLDISRDYSDSADKLHDKFFSSLDTLFNIINVGLFTFLFGLFAFLFGLFAFLWKCVERRTRFLFDKRIVKVTTQYDEKFAQFLTQQDDAIKRVIRNEDNTIYLKKNTYILFLHKTNTFLEDTPFGQLQKAVFAEFDKKVSTYSPSLENIAANLEFQKLSKSTLPYKLVIMDDNLFNDYLEPVQQSKQYRRDYTEQGKKLVNNFIELLENEGIGLVIFGNTKLTKNPTYYAFANSPYSLYSNLNNLLKYMHVIKSAS